MSLLTHNSTPAERARGCTFAETFESADAVVRNGASIVGTPNIDFGAVLDGTADAFVYQKRVATLIGTKDFSIVVKFNASTAQLCDFVGSRNAGYAAGGIGFSCGMSADGAAVAGLGDGTNFISDSTLVSSGAVDLADGQDHTLCYTYDRSGNVTCAVDGVATGVTASIAAIGDISVDYQTVISRQAYSASRFFLGTLYEVKIFVGVLLTTQEALDIHNNETYTYENECSLYLPMGAAQHDPSNGRTLDVSGNGRNADFGDGVTPTTFPTKVGRHHGYSFDGVDDYMTTAGSSVVDSGFLTFALEFTPNFGPTYNGYIFLLDGSVNKRHALYKGSNAVSNVLGVYMGGTAIASVPQATYAPFWKTNSRNLCVVAGTSGSTQMWLNSYAAIHSAPNVWISNPPDELFVGASYVYSAFFPGKIHSLRWWKKKLTSLQILDMMIRTLGKVNDV